MKLTRRQVLAGAAGIYALVDGLAQTPARASAGPRPREQHLLDGIRVVHDNDVEVLVPPLHHQVVTARVTAHVQSLGDAQPALEAVLSGLEADYAATPAGLGVTVAWGKPYFERFVPDQAAS